MNLSNKVAVVTGGAHRVGKAIALALAQEGAHLVIHYGGSEQAALETVREIEALGARAVPIQADLRDPAQVDRLFAAIETHFDHLDIFVNSAANFLKRPFDEISLGDWQDVMQTNLRGPFLCSQSAARLMRRVARPANEPALIVNIADLSGIYPWQGYALHGLSKAGIIHLTKVSAYELAPHVRVNAVAPGAVLPPPTIDPDGEFWQNMGARLPLRRVGHPDHVAQTVVFLAHNDFITGAVIPVDGGEHLIGTLK
jgi:NAD(P)-dependent dehydrogenase (short-subunit alcohol dehydrogenase family)